MSFSSLIGSGFIPRNYGIIGITTEGINPIPLATIGTPVTVVNKDLTGLSSKFYVFNYTMVIHCINQNINPTGLTLELKGLNNVIYSILDNVTILQDQVREINLIQIQSVENGTANINLTYTASIPINSTATYDFQGIISYEPIELFFVPPPV
jgi:hypothetical protein